MDRAMTLPVEREKEKAARISPTALIRRSGLLAAAGGAYLAVLPFVHPESPQSVAWVPVHLVYFASLAVVLLALVGIFARQIERAGRLGVAGFRSTLLPRPRWWGRRLQETRPWRSRGRSPRT